MCPWGSYKPTRAASTRSDEPLAGRSDGAVSSLPDLNFPCDAFLILSGIGERDADKIIVNVMSHLMGKNTLSSHYNRKGLSRTDQEKEAFGKLTLLAVIKDNFMK